MWVDLVITELEVGGAERCLTELAVGLADAGDRVRVFSLAPLPTGDHTLLVDRLRERGIPVASGQLRGWMSLPGCLRRLRRWLSEPAGQTAGEPVDPRDPPHQGVGRSRRGRMPRPRICQTFLFHANVLGTWAACSLGIDVRSGGLRVAHRHPLRCRVERLAVARMTLAVCVSQGVRRFAIDSLRADPDRLRVIPNGIDPQRFARVTPVAWHELGWPDDAAVATFVGRLHPQKGLELLQRQIDRLAPPGSHRRLLLIGDGPLRDPLRRWAETVSENRVRLLGWRPDVLPWIAGSRLLILPSHYEGMPNVALEAMACGRPVVISRVEGSQELLSEAVEGQGFPPGDDEAMADAAERFLADAGLADRVGESNRRLVGERYSLAQMVTAYRELYRESLASAAADRDA